MAAEASVEDTFPVPRLYTDFIAQAAYDKEDLVTAQLTADETGELPTDPQAKNDRGDCELGCDGCFHTLRVRWCCNGPPTTQARLRWP